MVKFFDAKTSIFLDIIRFLCALIVMATHSFQVIFNMSFGNHYLGDVTHGAVILFFVLSGYVIAYTTTAKKRTFVEYAIARLSRLYSIFFPAIILTIICAYLTFKLNPDFYDLYNNGNEFVRYLLGLTFLNEIWFVSAAPRINGVIWSLGYEFWFYAVFGVIYFKKKGLKGLLLPLLVCLFVGPKILLMMVIWLFGFVAFRLPKFKMSDSISWMLVFVFLAISILFMRLFSGIPDVLGIYPLFWASQFITDYIVGAFFALSIWFLPLRTIKIQSGSLTLKAQKVFRIIGDLTFPIYVLHMPLLVLFKSVMPTAIDLKIQFLIVLTFTFIVCAILGVFLESKKHWWSQMFNRISLDLSVEKKVQV